jgi:hypothetical protein
MLTVAAMAGADVAAGVLAVAGVAKVREPAGFAAFTAALGLRVGRAGARAVGMVELACAVAVVAVGGRICFAVLAAVYVALAAVSGLSVARAAPGCGCFGAVTAPTSRLQVGLDVALAASAVVAAVGDGASLVARSAGFRGAVYAVVLAVATSLAVTAVTTGAELAALRRREPRVAAR